MAEEPHRPRPLKGFSAVVVMALVTWALAWALWHSRGVHDWIAGSMMQ